tara:strand:+ start:1086 stop:1889 length:804 start_codon:yes stop_codon:yes gene_type:complete
LSRGLSSAIKTELASGAFVMAHLVKISTPTISTGVGSLEDFTPSPTADWQSMNHTGISGVSSGGGTGATFNISVDGTGEVVTFSINNAGSGYSEGETIIVTDPGNTSSTCTLTVIVMTDYYQFTDFSSDIVDGSDTYSANGFLQKIGSISESAGITTGSLSLSLSGVNQTFISDLLGNGHIHRKMIVKRAFINASTNALIESFSIYTGHVEGMDITDSDKTSLINLRIANQWSDFARLSGRRTNSGSQNQFFPNDKGFDFITHSNLN